MLQLSSYLLNRPVLSLRSGNAVAWVSAPIFNPHNLRIEGFYVKTRDRKDLILLCQDIRETGGRGLIVNDYDVLAEPQDLVRLKALLELNFELPGKAVHTTTHEKVGKVSDYAVETMTMYVQKLYASQPIWKNLGGGTLSIDRSQIVEITNKTIVIGDLHQTAPAPANALAV